MPTSGTCIVERISRVLAGQQLSLNGEGGDEHAAAAVEMEWEDRIEDALAILRTMREPDKNMEAAGDVAVWKRMIAAAIGSPKEIQASLEPTPVGTDPLDEGP